jgi:hypothetical protein
MPIRLQSRPMSVARPFAMLMSLLVGACVMSAKPPVLGGDESYQLITGKSLRSTVLGQIITFPGGSAVTGCHFYIFDEDGNSIACNRGPFEVSNDRLCMIGNPSLCWQFFRSRTAGYLIRHLAIVPSPLEERVCIGPWNGTIESCHLSGLPDGAGFPKGREYGRSAQLLSGSFASQKPYEACVRDPARYLAMAFQEFDQGVRPVAEGPREEWGWREIARQQGCETAAATLISHWRERHPDLDRFRHSFMAFHEGQVRAGGGDYRAAIPLIEAGRHAFSDAAGQAYVDATLAFLRSDLDALIAARERLLAVPEPPNWPEQQRLVKEQAGQEMTWPRNIEATDTLIRCFGKPYPLFGEC